MQLKPTIATLLAAATMLAALPAFANPTDYVKKQTDVVTKVLQKPDSSNREKELTKLVKQTIDFRELANRALGEHWTKRTPEEQQQFLDLLQDLLQANYKNKLEGQTLGKDYKVTYADEKVREDKAIVKTIIVTKAESKPVEYKLYKNGEGAWAIFDVVIDDISLEETYRDSYVEIIEKEGWASLIKRMQDKAAEISAQAKNTKGAKTAAKPQ